MIEFILFVIIIVALIKFNSSVNLISRGAQDTTSSWLEDRLKDNAIERQERMAEVKQYKTEHNITKLATADDMLKELGIR
jgi:hypothetical protein